MGLLWFILFFNDEVMSLINGAILPASLETVW